ncbi:unnamed protein product [Caenorhabditis auriculariae]|uniref:Protein kinase domain-containing protein n=1 Tax=Caenorhabditis auriculariae TaxID=2777116 RepID=A0A8S1GTH8_9PELO|nr:unnamed protein product [Caenorhabditis auriculariae]
MTAMNPSYKLRFPFKSLKAGAHVEVTGIVQNPKSAIGLAKTSSGEIPLNYLTPNEYSEFLKNPVAEKIHKSYPLKDDVASGHWWLGRRSAFEAGFHLAVNRTNFGHYAVVQPTEWMATADAWPQLLLAVRTITGCIDQFLYEFSLDSSYNDLFPNFPERKVQIDEAFLPSVESYPPIMYFRIILDSHGQYQLLGDTQKFINLELLLSHYFENPLPILRARFGESVTLFLTSLANRPADTQWPIPGPECSGSPKIILPRPEMRTIAKNPFKDYHVRMWNLQYDDSNARLMRLGVMTVNGAFTKVCITTVNDPLYYNSKQLDEQISLLNTAAKDPKLHYAGYDNLVHFVDVGIDSNFFWRAVEYAEGLSLQRVLQKRKVLNENFSQRIQCEIAYQIASGMAFLERNGLCHKQLMCSKILVTKDSTAAMVVKVADYMLSHHFLNDKKGTYHEEMVAWPWAAPEALLNREYGIRADVWSFGCVIFEIMTLGKAPFSYENLREPKDLKKLFEKKDKMKLNEVIRGTYLALLCEFCQNYDIKERPKFKDLCEMLDSVCFDGQHQVAAQLARRMRKGASPGPVSKTTATGIPAKTISAATLSKAVEPVDTKKK